MRLWPFIPAGLALVGVLFAGFYFLRSHPGSERSGVLSQVAWQRMASPGALSQPHTFLEHDCAACHTPGRGVEAVNCIACHANEQSLLRRQSTAFHADVTECAECHLEHRGIEQRPSRMDHELFARLSMREPDRAAAADPHTRTDAQRPAAFVKGDSPAAPPHAAVTFREAVLDCNACHGNEDRHRQLFGADCAQCHGTTAWTLPEFRHPLPSSTDCAQCHQAPPSHYMMHFQMVSMKVAGIEHADVSQCFLCHKTNAWNDIKGVGWYKHH